MTHTQKIRKRISGDLIFVVRVDKNDWNLWMRGSSEQMNEVEDILLKPENLQGGGGVWIIFFTMSFWGRPSVRNFNDFNNAQITAFETTTQSVLTPLQMT
jgi:hypothetical protein